MLETLFNWLVEQQLLMSTLLISLLILERYSLKWLSANFVYKLWLLLPASLLLTNLPAHLKPLPNASMSKMLITPEQAIVANFSVSWAVVYTFVFIGLVFIAALTHQRFIKQLRLTVCNDTERLKQHPNVPILQSDAINTPMVIGLLQTQLVLPTGYLQKTDSAALALIIEHEQVHIKRADNLFNMMLLVITLVCWFNPLAWFGYMSFRRLQELSCDERVLADKNIHQRILYAKALINCTANARAGLIAYSHYGDKNMMLQRLKQIKHNANDSFVAKGAILILAAGMLSNFAIAKQPDVKKQQKVISPTVRIEPLYPKQAAEQGISGSVVLKYDISPAGNTKNISVIQSKPVQTFDQEAKSALAKWQYKPTNTGFKDVLIQLDFAIDNEYKSDDFIEKVTVAAK